MDWRPKTIKVLEENTRKKLCDKEVGFGNHFLNIIPKKKATKEKNKLKFNKIQKFCASKNTTNRVKRQPMKWG